MNTDAETMVWKLLKEDKSGHDFDHIQRVRKMASALARELHADLEMTDLLALLHDVDDYKLVGKNKAEQQGNARTILEAMGKEDREISQILSEISKLGFSKSMQQIEPETLEGRICQDADFLDALGVYGLLRAYDYGKFQGQKLFEPDKEPKGKTTLEAYTTEQTHVVQHFFDKLLKLDQYMLTDPGKSEAARRIRFLETFLEELFEEEEAPTWKMFLNQYRSAVSG